LRVRGPDSQDAVVWICCGRVLTAAFSRREQPVVHRDVCLGRQQRRACLPEHPHRYVVSLHLTNLYNRSCPRLYTVDTHAPQSMWQYPPKAIHRHLPLCQPHVPFLDKPRNMLTRARNLPHRLQQGPRPGRERPERPRRRAQDPVDPAVGRRRAEEGMLLDEHTALTMYCTCTPVATRDCDCGASTSTIRYACHVQCNAMQCNCANMSTSHVKFHGVQDVSFWSIYPLSTPASCLCFPPIPHCRRLAVLDQPA
jgi:hypothetical protein